MQALILVATKGGPTMLARIGVMRALQTGVQFRPERSTLGEAKAGTGLMISAFRFSLPEGDCRGHGSEMKEAAN
jgi:hypothetical protein